MSVNPATDTARFPPSYSVGPRLLMAVCWGCAVLVVIGLGLLIWAAPGSADGTYELLDIVGLLLVAAFLLALLWRFGQVRIFVSPQGVRVRNFFHTYRFTWPQILRVSMTTSDSWAVLELNDGSSCTVLALPASEGKTTTRCVVDLRVRLVLYGESKQPPTPPK